MEQETCKQSSASTLDKRREYRRRTRPGRTSTLLAATRSTTGGKTPSSFRKQQIPSRPNHHDSDVRPLVIPFSVPSALPTDYLMQMAPVVLARHLLYARGLWPMSVPQLMLVQQQEQQIENNGLQIHAGNSVDTTTDGKRRRISKNNRVSPSLRRKQKQAMAHITRLCDNWYAFLAHFKKNCSDEMYSRASPHRVKSPRYLLISLGPSYERSEELYLLDFDSIIDDDRDSNCNDIEPKGLSHEKAERMEATLARKLISALMNQPGRGNEESVLQSLPKATSPSFRLYFTAGFKTPDSGVAPTNANDVPATTERHAQSGCTSNALVQENDPPLLGIHVNLTSLKSWIPRKRFPLLQRHYQSRSSSRVQSLVTIRFQRSHLRQQQENYTDEKKTGERLGNTPTTCPQMHPASNELTWMSSSVSIKGFRL